MRSIKLKPAPDWAKWIAQDQCGVWFYYEHRPSIVTGSNVVDGVVFQERENSRVAYAGVSDNAGWRTSRKKL